VSARLGQSNALLVTVNYKGEQSTLELLVSLRRLNGFSSLDVIVVDNGSGEENLSQLRVAIASLPNVQLLVSATNRGYFGAAKFAYDHYLGQGYELPDWTIVCNHVVVINDQEFLLKLSSEDWRSAGVLAPRVRLAETGTDQNPFMLNPPGRWRRFTMRFYSSCYPLGRLWDWLSRQKRSLHKVFSSGTPPPEIPRQIYAAHGSFLIFSRSYFMAGGLFDESLFLFGEEIAVAETCRKLGLKVLYAPGLQVLHDEHSSVGPGMSRTAYQYHRQSVRHLFSKYLQGY
jgi:GT2 family glycosyltransferase